MYNKGVAKSILENYRGAIDDYTKAIELSPNMSEAYYQRGIAKVNLKYYLQAISDQDKAIECNKLYLSGRDKWDPYYSRGLVKLIIQDYQGAIEDFNKTIELSSKHYIPVDETELALNDHRKYLFENFIGLMDRTSA